MVYVAPASQLKNRPLNLNQNDRKTPLSKWRMTGPSWALYVHCSFFDPLIRSIRAGWPSILMHWSAVIPIRSWPRAIAAFASTRACCGTRPGLDFPAIIATPMSNTSAHMQISAIAGADRWRAFLIAGGTAESVSSTIGSVFRATRNSLTGR